MAEKNHPLAAWKDTKKRIKGKGAKLFVDWFDDILFNKAKINHNLFYGETGSPTSGSAGVYGMWLTDPKKDKSGNKVAAGTELGKVIKVLKKITDTKSYKSWGFVDLDYPTILVIEYSTGKGTPISMKVIDYATGQKKTEKNLFKFKFGFTGLKVRDPNLKPGQEKEPPKPGGAAWTAIQEKITLKIFEHLWGGGITGVTGFGPNPSDKTGFCHKVIGKGAGGKMLWDNIHHPSAYSKKTGEPMPGSWLGHFQRQYNAVSKNLLGLPHSHYDVYSYTKFMSWITDMVTSRAWPKWPGGNISKKDSWNPADIWLISNQPTAEVIKAMLNAAPTIAAVNQILRRAFQARYIVGISLKQSDKSGVKYEEVNTKLTQKVTKWPFKGSLPTSKKRAPAIVQFHNFVLRLPFKTKKIKGNITRGNFDIKTNELKVQNDSGTAIALARIGSSASGAGNIRVEFKAIGNSAAQLGQCPRDLLGHLLKDNLPSNLSPMKTLQVPSWKDGTEERVIVPPKGTRNRGKDPNYQYWTSIVDTIISKKVITYDKSLEEFVDNLSLIEKNGTNGAVSPETATCLQIVELAFLVSMIPKGKRNMVFQNMYYYAQKKGSVMGSQFGPFGKLY